MPGGDQTGPNGQGPKTGGGFGKCNGNSANNDNTADNANNADSQESLIENVVRQCLKGLGRCMRNGGRGRGNGRRGGGRGLGRGLGRNNS